MPSFDDCVNLNTVSKSIRFGLEPVGQTNETVKNFLVIEQGKQRKELYPRAKAKLDLFYRNIIESGLSTYKTDGKEFVRLYDSLTAFKTDRENAKEYFDCANTCRKLIVKVFTDMESFSDWGKGNTSFIKDLFEQDEVLSQTYPSYGMFATYCLHKTLLFSDMSKTGSIANRIINENFPKFYGNTEKLLKVRMECPALYAQFEEAAQTLSLGTLDEFTDPKNYQAFFSTIGNTRYNTLIGGFTKEDGTKVQGLNEIAYVYFQQNGTYKVRFEQLNKNIGTESLSFSAGREKFEEDADLYNALDSAFYAADICNCALSDRIERLSDFDLSHVYIQNKAVADISIKAFGPGMWNSLFDSAVDRCINSIQAEKGKVSAKDFEKAQSIRKQEYFSFEEIVEVLKNSDAQHKDIKPVIALLNKYRADFNSKKAAYDRIDKSLPAKKNTDTIRNALYAANNFLNFLYSFTVPDEMDKDAEFYDEEFTRLKEVRSEVNYTLNRTRDYITTIVKKGESYPINFNIATIGTANFGWDINRESTNKTVILRKEEQMYLLIYAEKNVSLSCDEAKGTGYERLCIRNIGDVKKQLPKVVFAAKNQGEPFAPSEKLHIAYTKKKSGDTRYFTDYGTQENYDKALLLTYHKAVCLNPEWNRYIQLKDASSYDNLEQLFDDCSSQGYKMWFENVSAAYVDSLVKDGKAYLFRIYNTDLNKGHDTGNSDLHTIYWKQLFSEENLKTGNMKLCGNLSITFREGTGETDKPHRKGSKLVNKLFRDGRRIPSDVYYEIYNYVNGKSRSLSEKAQKFYESGEVVIKDCPYDILLGARYLTDKYFMTVPVQFNCHATGENINDRILDKIKTGKVVNVLGISRGEKNLVYATVINGRKEILYQSSLNVLDGPFNSKVDFQEKLAQLEKDRTNDRENWRDIKKIENVKNGYLSALIPKIINIALEYNAIIVLEDLNSYFKNSRAAFEKNIYQQFESALISKLELLIFKTAEQGSAGSASKPMQLGNRVTAYKDIKGQNGIMFYVDPANTASVDPVTGFANIFDFSAVTNHKARKEFFGSFDAIRYKGTSFEFDFRYKNFKCYCDTKKYENADRVWTISTQGERSNFKDRKLEVIEPTVLIKDALNKNHVSIHQDTNLVDILSKCGVSQSDIAMVNSVFEAFRATLRTKNTDKEYNDYFVSCVKNENGETFNTQYETKKSKLPYESDGVASFMIACKGLFVMERFRSGKEKALYPTKEEWLTYIQK